MNIWEYYIFTNIKQIINNFTNTNQQKHDKSLKTQEIDSTLYTQPKL